MCRDSYHVFWHLGAGVILTRCVCRASTPWGSGLPTTSIYLEHQRPSEAPSGSTSSERPRRHRLNKTGENENGGKGGWGGSCRDFLASQFAVGLKLSHRGHVFMYSYTPLFVCWSGLGGHSLHRTFFSSFFQTKQEGARGRT